MINGDASAFDSKQLDMMSAAYDAVCERLRGSIPDVPEERLRSMVATIVIELAMQPDCGLSDIVRQATARIYSVGRRFKVGQRVRFRPGYRGQDLTKIFVVEKALAIEGAVAAYRLKNETEAASRIGEEHELVLVAELLG